MKEKKSLIYILKYLKGLYNINVIYQLIDLIRNGLIKVDGAGYFQY